MASGCSIIIGVGLLILGIVKKARRPAVVGTCVIGFGVLPGAFVMDWIVYWIVYWILYWIIYWIGEMDQANQPSRGTILSILTSCPRQQPLLAFTDPAHLDTAPVWKGFGAATRTSPPRSIGGSVMMRPVARSPELGASNSGPFPAFSVDRK
jgi:hypothetical protein